MAALDPKHLNQWDQRSWSKDLGSSRHILSIDGALFEHHDPALVYFMTEAGGPGVRFEFQRSDIVDVADNPQPLALFGKNFKSVRIGLKVDAFVTRISLHVAAGLIEPPDATITNIAGATMKIKNTVMATVLMR